MSFLKTVLFKVMAFVACAQFAFAAESGDRMALDKSELSAVEELSESLANGLLEFSVAVRDRNLRRVAEFFDLKAIDFKPWPTAFPEGEAVKPWLSYARIPGSHTLYTGDILSSWTGLLDLFSTIEDVRFKVKDAEFSEGATSGTKIKFFLVGRDLEERRWWLKGTGHLDARRESSGQWKINSWEMDEIHSYKTSRDFFSEIAFPAGLAVNLPSYGSPGNDDFVYHGAAAGDLDSDGFIDLVVTGIAQSYVYRNLGNGRFEQIGSKVGLPPMPQATAPLLLDYDNDGDLDVFFSATGQQMLFENQLVPDGRLFFLDYSAETGVDRQAVGFSAVAGDVNADGWPDIYVASYNRYGLVLPNSWHQATNGTQNLLFINQGDGSFRERSSSYGVGDSRWSYSAQFIDFNGDGKQDLYVANDYGENAFYVNLGDRFEDRALELGVLDPGNGMGVAFGDFDNDSIFDLFVTNMSSTAGNRILNRLVPDAKPGDSVLRKLASGSSLFKGNQDGSFSDVTERYGSFTTGWAWGGVMADLDNDGWQEIYSNSGFISGKSMKDT